MQIIYIRQEYLKPNHCLQIICIRRNTWNHITTCKLFILDRNTWNQITEYKLFILDRKGWNHITACKLFVLDPIMAGIMWSVCILKSHRSLCESFSRTGAGLCIYHLFVWSNWNFLHISKWTTLSRLILLLC